MGGKTALEAFRLSRIAQQLRLHSAHGCRPQLLYVQSENRLYANVGLAGFCTAPDDPFRDVRGLDIQSHAIDPVAHITIVKLDAEGFPPALSKASEEKVNECLRELFGHHEFELDMPVYIMTPDDDPWRIIMNISTKSGLHTGLVKAARLLCSELSVDPRAGYINRSFHLSIDRVHTPLLFTTDAGGHVE